jgi:hypothetical protein
MSDMKESRRTVFSRESIESMESMESMENMENMGNMKEKGMKETAMEGMACM